jgi:hypothetical protein
LRAGRVYGSQQKHFHLPLSPIWLFNSKCAVDRKTRFLPSIAPPVALYSYDRMTVCTRSSFHFFLPTRSAKICPGAFLDASRARS